MKMNFKAQLLALIMLTLLVCCGQPSTLKDYKVEVTYCDGREKKIIEASGFYEAPTNQDIQTYKRAVPVFAGELNVCEIRVIECINNKSN
jgi:hypothetical protein